MTITWHGTAALVLREGEAAIAFDPFFGAPVGCFSAKHRAPLPADALDGATDVFVTHGHFDHIAHLPALCGAAPFRIHCTEAPRRTLTRRGVSAGRIVPIAAGETRCVGPFSVTAYRGRHCRFDLPLIARTVFRRRFWRHPVHLIRLIYALLRSPQRGEILMYEVSCGGQRTQILGSLGLDENTVYPTGADLLILPYQGRSDLVRTARAVVTRLAPRAVLLDHWDDAFPPVSDDIDTRAFIASLRAQEHIPCRAMKKGRNTNGEEETTLGRP